MEYEQFTREYAAAYEELVAGRLTDLDAIRRQLRGLADQLSARDQESAYRLIDRMVVPETPADQSAEMAEALRVLDSADFESGTDEERLAAYAAARREIWAIADRAGADSHKIRGLTRGLESSENYLTDPPWNDPPPAGA